MNKAKLPPFTWKTLADIEDDCRAHEELMNRVFEHDQVLGYISIKAPCLSGNGQLNHPYHIALKRIPNPKGLLQWVHHLSGKAWMTQELIHEFIERVCSIKGWDLYQRNL